jgi:hypothetical protein
VKKKADKKPLDKNIGDRYYDNREEESSGKHNDLFKLINLVTRQ